MKVQENVPDAIIPRINRRCRRDGIKRGVKSDWRDRSLGNELFLRFSRQERDVHPRVVLIFNLASVPFEIQPVFLIARTRDVLLTADTRFYYPEHLRELHFNDFAIHHI